MRAGKASCTEIDSPLNCATETAPGATCNITITATNNETLTPNTNGSLNIQLATATHNVLSQQAFKSASK